jgi:DNA-binding LytR/AlgR family response regulator
VLRALVIDDESPARQEMRYLLEQTGEVLVCGEASNVHEAVSLIKAMTVDVLFLDINMPEYSGLQLANSLRAHPSPPLVVFVTAHSKFALAAFEVDAVDYLMKPVDPRRLDAALQKVKERMEMLPAPEEERETRIVASKGTNRFILNSSEIVYFMAKDDYTYIFARGDYFLSTSSLASYEVQLENSNFFRTHRRYLVNLDWVDVVEPTTGGTLTLSLKDDENTRIPVSRRRAIELKQKLGL